MLACRLCRYPINSLDGCDVCRDFKKNLVAVNEDDEEQPSLTVVSQEIIVNLRALSRRAKQLMENSETFDKGATLAMKAGNTASKVLEAARKLQTDGLEAIKNMSFLERARLYIGWYASLPGPYRLKVRAGQDKLEAETNKPLELAEAPAEAKDERPDSD